MPQLVGKDVGEIGLGLMRLTWVGKPKPQAVAFAAMKRALASGSNCWNGGEIYGPPDANSLQLLNAYFTENPDDADKVVLSIKGGFDMAKHAPDGSAEGIKKSVDNCLRILDGKKFLDLFECARVDPNVPIEETIRALADYVKAGKIGGISLSEVGPKTIRRAAAAHKIEAVEVEFSMFSPDILTNGVGKACAELGIPIIGYSPLSRGFLTGTIKSRDDLDEARKMFPRFAPGNFEENMKLAEEVGSIAKKHGSTPGQVALAWCLSHSGKNGMATIIPIPGGSTEEQVAENTKSIKLSDGDLKDLNDILKRVDVKGGRYPEAYKKLEWAGEEP